MNNLKKKSIKKQIILISGLVVGIIVILYILVIYMLHYMIQLELEMHNKSMQNNVATQIVEMVEIPLGLVENIEFLLEDEPPKSEMVTKYLESIQKSYAYFEQIQVVNLDGTITNSAPYDPKIMGNSIKQELYYPEEQMIPEEQCWSGVYQSEYTKHNLISVIIMKDDYYIVVDINLKELPIKAMSDDFFEEISSLEILDRQGNIILDKNNKTSKVKEMYQNSNIFESGDSIDSYYNLKYGYIQIKPMNWIVVCEFKYEDIDEKMSIYTEISFLFWILAIGFMYIVLKRYSRNVDKDMKYLQNRALSIIRNFNDISDKRNLFFKEFDEFNNDFSTMLYAVSEREDKIIEINENLELIIEERTKNLEEINVHLEEEIMERKTVENEVKIMNENLDKTVSERTSQLELLNIALKRSVEESDEANKAKGTFLSIMSHEMRTPLNGILGFIQMLKRTKLDDEQKEIVSIVEGSSKTLLELISDILDVEKYSAGKMMFSEEPIHLLTTIKNAVTTFKSLAESKGLQYQMNISELLDIFVIGDATKLNQLINNLVSNALKFTEHGTISITVDAKIVEDRARIEIRVADSGIGISSEKKQYLFKPFTQASEDISRKYGGTGLGLAICKEIVNHYNGTIDFEGVENQGTTFVVELVYPITESGASFNLKMKKRNKDIIEKVFDGKILIAEDNLINQKLMKKFLDKHGVEFMIVGNGQEAVDACRENKIAIVLMDCQMPIMDGFEATKAIRKEFGNQLEIIAMTAYASNEDKIKCYDAGMNKFLTKPVDLEELESILGIGNCNRENATNKMIDYQTYIEEEARNLMRKIDFDYETSVDLIQTFKEQTEQGLDEMVTLIEQNDYVGISKKVHQLKGSAGAVRLDRFRIIFEKIEEAIKIEDYSKINIYIERVKSDRMFNRQE